MKNINPSDLKKKLDNNQVILVDVREPAEYRSEHIPNSYSVPLRNISIDSLPVRDKSVVFLCRSGRRSGDACQSFISKHPEIEVFSLEGGINGWKDAGYSVETAGKGFIPLERQIQFVAGLLTFLGVVAGAFINPWFYLLSGFVGCGLMFAGITGWCGMGMILAMMPWNK